MNDMIIYDHPLNEIIRACLRLEQLFQQIDLQLNDLSMLGTRNSISSIINILQILDRPDLKSKLAKEFTHHLSTLNRLSSTPEGNTDEIKHLIQKLEEHARTLIESSGKLGYRLRDIELLNTLRMHLASPGGGCSFDMPIYHYWLQLPSDARKDTIQEWLNDFVEIRTIVGLLLELVRNNAKSEEKIAVHGFHQELLDPQSNLRMIRIGIKSDVPTYPEISIGRHFLSVRFYSPILEKRPTQYAENLSFWISYCNL